MKRISVSALLILTLFIARSQAQVCEECRYLSPVFDSVAVTTVHFGEGLNIDGEMQQLYMDVYEPVGDTATDRPVVIFAFGGGFVQGSRTDWYVREVCEFFAKAGYVAVANDYRLGIDPLEILFLQHMRIFFRPMQDMRATVQYLKADYAELGDNFRIDTARIIIGGASAGAITALMTAYCDRPEEMAEMGDLGALDELGGFYATSGLYPQYSWNGLATVNVAGALINADWVEAGDIPTIAAHGDADIVVPYGYGPLGGGLLGGVFDLQGSSIVHQHAEEVGVCSYLFTMEGHDHPNTGMGMDYIRSVVMRIAQRAYALINDRTFCCELSAEIAPADTLFHHLESGPQILTAELENASSMPEYHWCSYPCGLTGNGTTVLAQPDTTWETISLIAHEGGCQAQDIHIVSYQEMGTSVEELKDAAAVLSLYPSPASDVVNVRFRADEGAAGLRAIEVVASNGQPVLRQSVPSDSGQLSVDISSLSAGLYLLRVGDGSLWVASGRFVVTE